MTSLILCKFSLLSLHFWILVLGCKLFAAIYTEIDNWDLDCCSRLDFLIFVMMKEIKNWSFLDYALPGKREFSWSIYTVYSFVSYARRKNRSLVYIASKLRIFWCWIHSSFVCQQIHKKIYPLVRWTAKYVFFISEAMKIAVSFSKFQCLYAMLLLWDNSKHGFWVA